MDGDSALEERLGDMRVSGEGEGGEDTQTRAAVAGVQYDNM